MGREGNIRSVVETLSTGVGIAPCLIAIVKYTLDMLIRGFWLDNNNEK